MNRSALHKIGHIDARDEVEGVYACIPGVFVVGNRFDGSRETMSVLREALSAWLAREHLHAMRVGANQ